MVFARSNNLLVLILSTPPHSGHTHHYGRYNGRDEKSKIDLHVREHDKPLVPRASLQLACAFSTSYATSGIFATDA